MALRAVAGRRLALSPADGRTGPDPTPVCAGAYLVEAIGAGLEIAAAGGAITGGGGTPDLGAWGISITPKKFFLTLT